MGTLLIVRHGETEWNAVGRIQGHTDIGLSEKGAEQALALGERLDGLSIDAAYSSDLKRSSETAKIALGGREIVLNETPMLREYHKGAFEGLTLPEIKNPEKIALSGGLPVLHGDLLGVLDLALAPALHTIGFH